MHRGPMLAVLVNLMQDARRARSLHPRLSSTQLPLPVGRRVLYDHTKADLVRLRGYLLPCRSGNSRCRDTSNRRLDDYSAMCFCTLTGGERRTNIGPWAWRVWPIFVLATVVTVSGCASISGGVLRDSREQFNETAQTTNAEQLLHNIVRLRYGSSTYFLEISTVSTSATIAGNLALSGNTASPGVGLSPNFAISPSLSYSQTPSFVFQPLTGEKLGRQLLRPVDMRTLALLRTAGWDLREILLVLVDSINGISNAPAATQFAPETVPENMEFRHVVGLLNRLEGQGLIQLGLDSGVALQDARGDIALSLQIDRAAASTPEGQELIHKLALDPANLTYRLVAAASGGGGKNIAVKPRSILAAMRYLSKGIDVPDVDVRGGLVPAPRGAGSEFVWATLMSDVVHIASSETWPASAYVRVFHNGHWFYIDNADLVSKQSFALLETALALQAGEVPPISTILTLPISR